MRTRIVATLASFVLCAARALAQSPGDSLQAPPPAPATRLTWPGILIILILALFLTAAIAGPLIRANMRDDLDSAS